MNNLKIFENAEFGQIRTAEVDGEPGLSGKMWQRRWDMLNREVRYPKKVEEVDRGVAEMETPSGKQNMTIINESGLYALIFGSKLESAKRFKHWVTSEVLPAIRKHGAYAVDELLNNPEMAIKAFTALKEEREKKQEAPDGR